MLLGLVLFQVLTLNVLAAKRPTSSNRRLRPRPKTTTTTTTTTTPAPTTTVPYCKPEKKRLCAKGEGFMSKGFRQVALFLHRELRSDLGINDKIFPEETLESLRVNYDCDLERKAYTRVKKCSRSLYSTKAHNYAVIRNHLGQEKITAFLTAFSWWRNGKQKMDDSKNIWEPHSEYDKLLWQGKVEVGCAAMLCGKKGPKFIVVNCEYDLEDTRDLIGFG
ncbi:unnamed protein product [Cylicocyclus nassatus]|uniref:SCP domain-containing protein n=1 Tax=Cylicocyclus nassatus TaxID=53992 RepID=A0AA36M2U5_CYLNA|nr:unnamed protein product [Cylicocyclus nassatus]